MRNKRDLLARIQRLQQLIEGLNIELVQVAIDREPLTQEQRQAYCRAVEEMVHAAKAALVPLQAAAGRLTHEEETSSTARDVNEKPRRTTCKQVEQRGRNREKAKVPPSALSCRPVTKSVFGGTPERTRARAVEPTKSALSSLRNWTDGID
jgi:hypothetical protein